MITEQDLQAAIAECEGVRNPTSNTCLKLAAYYTIKDKMYPNNNAGSCGRLFNGIGSVRVGCGIVSQRQRVWTAYNRKGYVKYISFNR